MLIEFRILVRDHQLFMILQFPHYSCDSSTRLPTQSLVTSMVGRMVQNSRSLNSFAFNTFIVIHEYIYSHSTSKFLFKKYINSHITTCFFFTNIFTHIYGMYSFTFNGLYSFTFTIEILVQRSAIFIQHFLHTAFAHHKVPAPAL